MVEALDCSGLQIRKEPGATKARVISTKSFSVRRGIKICVWIGAAKRNKTLHPLGGRTDFEKLKLVEANERCRTLAEVVAATVAQKQAAEEAVATLQAQLQRAQLALQRGEQRAEDLQASLLEAHRTIQLQEQKLAHASVGGNHPLYRRVGLDPACPDFVLQAVRHAYVKAFHPDHRPVHEKDHAQEKLKKARASDEKSDPMSSASQRSWGYFEAAGAASTLRSDALMQLLTRSPSRESENRSRLDMPLSFHEDSVCGIRNEHGARLGSSTPSQRPGPSEELVVAAPSVEPRSRIQTIECLTCQPLLSP